MKGRKSNVSRENAVALGAERPYRQAQEWGLPSRITGVRGGGDLHSAQAVSGVGRKEVVIENDIGWRIETMVDYLFGKPIIIESAAPDPDRRRMIGELLRMIFACNGGIIFLQQLALIGSVHGFVDVLVKLDSSIMDAMTGGPAGRRLREVTGGACHLRELGQPPVADDPASDGAGLSDGTLAGSSPLAAKSALEQETEPSQTKTTPSQTKTTPSPTKAEPSQEAGSLLDDSTIAGASHPSQTARLARLARMIRLEIVEPARALPVLSSLDYRIIEAYAQIYVTSGEHRGTIGERGGCAGVQRGSAGESKKPQWRKFLRQTAKNFLSPSCAPGQKSAHLSNKNQILITEILTPTHWQRYENEKLIDHGTNSLCELPLVHIQNSAVPFEYAGGSDVEPLIPLQDELNTRLSDRANRITMQSFKMYLGKGIENFTSLPIAPGRMWMTDNDQADVIEFGGDAASPSEESHISELREAIDKTSGVTPIAAGAIKGRIGRLTSAAALRITMLSLLAKTEKKRTTYGGAIERMCELALAWLDRAGLFHTSIEERRVELNWPSPLPENDMEKLQEAQAKARLGVPREILLRELGY